MNELAELCSINLLIFSLELCGKRQRAGCCVPSIRFPSMSEISRTTQGRLHIYLQKKIWVTISRGIEIEPD
jgi:hypothetical protein